MKTNDIVINITPEGNLEFVEGQMPLDLPLGNGTRRRLSHMRPEVFWKKIAFILLRKIFCDRGNVEFLTRKWKGPWRATIISTGQTEVFNSRGEAIMWELEILNGALFDL